MRHDGRAGALARREGARGCLRHLNAGVEHADDLGALANLRSTLRSWLQASPLTDEARFVRGLEAAYREMALDAG